VAARFAKGEQPGAVSLLDLDHGAATDVRTRRVVVKVQTRVELERCARNDAFAGDSAVFAVIHGDCEGGEREIAARVVGDE
jgi:hypothetical protein